MTGIIEKEILDEILLIFKEHIDDEPDDEYGGFFLWKYMEETKKNVRHLMHLVSHGYCDVPHLADTTDTYYFGAPMKLTKEGMDYLSKDGGLTAQKKIITIRLDEDTIKKLIEAKIELSDATKEEKHKLKQYLKGLGSKLLEAKMLDLLTLGINHIPDVARWLYK